jgi:hypothetical protein
MSTPYTVKRGDTLTSIATRHGFSNWRAIYNHPDNAGFRRLRPNPNRIYPGDVIQIPTTNPATAPSGAQPGPPVLISDDKCCHLIKDNECPYSGSKSQYTCPSGYVKFAWACCEGGQIIGCGECIQAASNPTTCWDADSANTACSIWWWCTDDCGWVEDYVQEKKDCKP